MNAAARRPSAKRNRGSGQHQHAPEPRFLAVGAVMGAHGIHGELKVEILTDDSSRFGLLSHVYLGQEGEEPRRLRLEGYRPHKGRILLRLEGCCDRNAAEALRGYLVQVPLAEAIPLDEGEYYEYQIIGLAVYTASGEMLGDMVEIRYTGANDVYVVQSESRKILIPALVGVILDVDLEGRRLIVQLPDGLL